MTRRGGGIGRRAGFKIRFLRECRFLYMALELLHIKYCIWESGGIGRRAGFKIQYW